MLGGSIESLFAPLALPNAAAAERLRKFLRIDHEPRVIDLLLQLPERPIERHVRPSLARLADGEYVTVTLQVVGHRGKPTPGARGSFVVVATDGVINVSLIHHGAFKIEFAKLLPAGARRRVSGLVRAGNRLRIYPDRIEDWWESTSIPEVDVLYDAGDSGISNAQVQKLIAAALGALPDLPEWHDAAFVSGRRWPSFNEALRRIHIPEKLSDVAIDGAARSRLAFDELLAHQLGFAITSAKVRAREKPPTIGNGKIAASILFDFPHALTPSQVRAVEEITADLAKPVRMQRLLQGDVGSGKTLVALLAAATVAEAGRQAALMAPTEILARQHLETIAPLAKAADMRVALLTSRTPAGERRQIIGELSTGGLSLLIGTQALLASDVVFEDLALAVIDEQHRFGAAQRTELLKKGEAADGLLLSATPIPRTMALAVFGGMDVSELCEKPAGRLPVTTTLHRIDRLDDVIAAVGPRLTAGDRVFWVCPKIGRSGAGDLAAATARYEQLREKFGNVVDIVHGRMKGTDKDAAMESFALGKTRLLVASTVVEVGIDVPEASVIVIESAERFGLATLHQLRGRVGRGATQSYCLLLHDAGAPTAEARLRVLREIEDGFRIAEEDLRLRGAGELLGTKQSGTPNFRLADLSVHSELLKVAADEARRIVASDPELTGPRGAPLRELRRLFAPVG